MNILYIISGSENVGTFFRAFNIGKNLATRGNNVTIVCAFEKPQWKLFAVRKQDNVTIINLIKTPMKWDYAGFILRASFVFFITILTSYDIIHLYIPWQPSSAAALIASYLKRYLGFSKSRIFADWDDYWGGDGIAVEHGPILSGMITKLEGFFPKFADHLTVCSTFLKNKAMESGIPEENISMIYNGADTNNIRPMDKRKTRVELELPEEKKILLYVGQFQTGVFVQLVKNVSNILTANKNIIWVILGNVPDKYMHLIRNNKRIMFMGKVPHSRLVKYLSSADVLLMPMEDSSVEKARFPIRFGEYLASGTPMLASPQGEIKSIIEKNEIAYTANINNPKAYKDILMKILSGETGNQIAMKARNFARNSLSWKAITDQVANIYMENKTVLIVSPFFSPNIGGVESHLDDLVRELNAKGFQSIVSTYKPLTTRISTNYKEVRGSSIIYRLPWFGHNWFHSLEHNPLLTVLYLLPGLYIQTFLLLLTNHRKITSVHAHGFVSALIVRLLNPVFRKKIYMSTHAIYSLPKRAIMAKVFVWILKDFTKIFTLSEKSKNELVSAGLSDNAISRYTYWVDQKRFNLDGKMKHKKSFGWERKTIFLFVGRLIKIKGVDVVLDIAKSVKSQDAVFVIIGTGPEEEHVYDESLHLKNVVFVNNMPNSTIDSYYKAADYLLVPSLYEEGMARVVMEGMSCGLYVVASNMGSLPEMVKPAVTGCLLKPQTDDYIKKVENILKNKIDNKKQIFKYATQNFSANNAKVFFANYE